MSDNTPETATAEQMTPCSVTALTRKIREVLETLSAIWVIGEISNLKYHTSGHIYFTLKDNDNQINCVVWQHTAKKLPFILKDGIEVLVCGDVTAYQGRYQITVKSLEPRGLGALLLAFENLKKKLGEAGLFDPAHKKPLPLLPRKICLVTSPVGAAVQDILTMIMNRFPALEIVIYPVRVQGEGAAKEIAAAIRTVNEHPYFSEVEVMIVGRGGGSLEDLWAFNEEIVAYAIYQSRIPIISAVGHEQDFTIADFVADRRALTPTHAGELVVPRLDHLLTQLNNKKNQLNQAIHHRFMLAKSQVARLATHRAFTKPGERVARACQQMDKLQQQLQHAMERLLRKKQTMLTQKSGKLEAQKPEFKLQRHRQALDNLAARLQRSLAQYMEKKQSLLHSGQARLAALSPLAVLRRGYAICFTEHGESVVRTHTQVTQGDVIWIRLDNSWIKAKIEKAGNKPARQ
jgi:exodeoxyribonuclease VII large subunit